MNTKYTIGMLVGLLAIPAVASAEMISGTITNIDPSANKITLLRMDTNDSITVMVKDQAALEALQTGNNVTLDANKKLFGGWEAKSVDADANAAVNSDVDAAAPVDGSVPTSEASDANIAADASTDMSASNSASMPVDQNRGASPITPSSSANAELNAQQQSDLTTDGSNTAADLAPVSADTAPVNDSNVGV